MKKTTLLLIALLSIFISCGKDDNSDILDKTRWVTACDSDSEYCYALTFNNGYVQKFKMDAKTQKVIDMDYTNEYSLQGEKLILYIKMYNGTIRPFEGKYKKGIIYLSGDKYYLN